MSGETATVSIGVNTRDRVATVTPPALVVERGTRVQFRLDEELRGKATVKVLFDSGQAIPGDSGLGVEFDATRTGIYYVVVTMSNPGKLPAMVVLIVDP